MMHGQDPVAYFNNPSLQFEVIFIAFEDELSTVLSIVLPYTTQTLRNLTHCMSSQDLLDAFSDSTLIGVDYKIPKMKFSSAKPLKSVFEKEGVKTIFGEPDFSLMASNKPKVSDIYQAVEIEVNETSVSIFAATALQFGKYSPKPIPQNAGINLSTTEILPTSNYSSTLISKNFQEFYVDRPFLLTIIGFLVNPVQSMVYQPNGVND